MVYLTRPKKRYTINIILQNIIHTLLDKKGAGQKYNFNIE